MTQKALSFAPSRVSLGRDHSLLVSAFIWLALAGGCAHSSLPLETPKPVPCRCALSPPSAMSKLTRVERGAIGNRVRACWLIIDRTQAATGMHVSIRVVTDASGSAQLAEVAPFDQSRVAADPALQAFSARAIEALLSPKCRTLPLPPSLLGRPQTLMFRFTP